MSDVFIQVFKEVCKNLMRFQGRLEASQGISWRFCGFSGIRRVSIGFPVSQGDFRGPREIQVLREILVHFGNF